MKRKYLLRLFGAVLMIGIGFGCAEILLRIYNAHSPSPVFYQPAYIRFRAKPFSNDYGFTINSRGFKDVEFAPKKPGTFRIVALGDSFAFGVVPYQYNYLTVLEEALKKKGYNVDVLNMGVPGTGPEDYATVLEEEGLALNPDLVLVSFYMGNDITNVAATDDEMTKLRNQSFTLSLLYYVFSIRPKLDGKIIHGFIKNYDDNAPTVTHDAFIDMEAANTLIFSIASDKLAFESFFGKVTTQIERMKELSAKGGAKIAFVIIPVETQIDATIRAEATKALDDRNRIPEEYDFSYPNAALTDWLNKNDIPLLDLYRIFQAKHDQGSLLYKPNDVHWNIAGNKLAAEEIEKYLESSFSFPVVPK